VRNLKTFSSTVACLIAISASVGSTEASATAIYSGSTKLGAGTEISATLNGSAQFETTGGSLLSTCTGGSLKGVITNGGGSTQTVQGSISASGWTWSGCTAATTVLEGGPFEWHWISGTYNATVTWVGFKINFSIFGTNCSYTVGSPYHVGTFRASAAAGFLGRLLKRWALRRYGGGFLCPTEIVGTAEYAVTSPTWLHVTQF
jgi:hypothetical protein